jgi:lipopolysaccharide/colanic/teichoic acid biosynthesis glycosyltransferase
LRASAVRDGGRSTANLVRPKGGLTFDWGRPDRVSDDRTERPIDGKPHCVADSPLPQWARCAKRALDVVIGTLGLVALSPILLIAVVAIRIDSSGPALFRQIRLGAGGKRFTLYKLRTMASENDDSAHQRYVSDLIRGEAERSQGVFKLVSDPRVTRVGRVLRQFSIDEIPQLWNVLRGDMSLVGPRPPLPREVALYDARTMERLRVKPGLTGLWQVSGRCLLSFHEMVALDVEYARRWSPAMELRILLRTPIAICSRRGAA